MRLIISKSAVPTKISCTSQYSDVNKVIETMLTNKVTRFVNKVTALKESLGSKGLNFSKCIAFMSDTTNVMKDVRSGVQKLIKNEFPNL